MRAPIAALTHSRPSFTDMNAHMDGLNVTQVRLLHALLEGLALAASGSIAPCSYCWLPRLYRSGHYHIYVIDVLLPAGQIQGAACGACVILTSLQSYKYISILPTVISMVVLSV